MEETDKLVLVARFCSNNWQKVDKKSLPVRPKTWRERKKRIAILQSFLSNTQTQKCVKSAISILFINRFSYLYFFFYQGFLSQTLTIQMTVGEERRLAFTPLYQFHPLMNIQTIICIFCIWSHMVFHLLQN